MRAIDILAKKRDKKPLTKEEIEFLIKGYTAGEISDYQMSAFLMATYLNGMNKEETAWLTMCMVNSGEQLDLSAIDGTIVDKHSTGGVGDKTTLILGPIVAACGAPVAKMSGRGLGHTGGTADKLEAITGYQIHLETKDFIRQVKEIGIALASQTGDLAPADKKIYALRDATSTVESIPLIAASIMSKKIASGADAILLDVKVGSGAFMKNADEAKKLAQTMIEIGEQVGRKTEAILTDMDMPLGATIGNSLEVIEAIDVLNGRGDARLTELCLVLSAKMLVLAGKGDYESCYEMAQKTITNGTALEKLKEVVRAQQGDVSLIEHPEQFILSPICSEYVAKQDGYITRVDTEACGMAACVLGAGRERKEDDIDYGAGIVLKKNYGDVVHKGEVIALLYTSDKAKLMDATARLDLAFTVDKEKPVEKEMIIK